MKLVMVRIIIDMNELNIDFCGNCYYFFVITIITFDDYYDYQYMTVILQI